MYHVEVQPAYINFITFYAYFCMYASSLPVSPFRQPNAGHIALPCSAKQQCHNTCGPACGMDMKLIPHYLIVTFVLNFLK